jgi:hypothetical protein
MSSSNYKQDVQQKDTQLKRLIKTRINTNPYKIYQLEDCFIAELDDVEVYRTKHQHLCTSYCQIKIAEERNRKNESIIKSIAELKAQGII